MSEANTKHTPGPRADLRPRCDQDGCNKAMHDGPCFVCAKCGVEHSGTCEEAQDERLSRLQRIRAAAPELLATLERLSQVAEYDNKAFVEYLREEVVPAARAAIARARGDK